MHTQELLDLVLQNLDDGKGREIRVIDLAGKTSIADFLIVVSGTSERHVRSLAAHLVEQAKQNDVSPLGVEGEQTGEWILIDLGDLIVHVMLPHTREFYQLEKLWEADFGKQVSETV